MFQEIMDIPEEKMIENAHGVLQKLDGIPLKYKLRLHLGLMQSVIETIMASGKLDQPELYTLLLDLGNDLEELVEELHNDSDA